MNPLVEVIPTRTVFQPGNKIGTGRPKGSPNKVTKTIRESILEAFEQVGGTEYLVKMATSPSAEDRRIFGALLARVLPTEAQASLGPTKIEIGWSHRQAVFEASVKETGE
jgi:hypothetical protein